MLLQVHGWIPDILEAQLENLEMLWAQWMDARRSPDWTLLALRDHEARIDAHLDAFVLAGEEAHALVDGGLGQGFAALDMASASAMLAQGLPARAEAVIEYFRGVDPEERDGVSMALRATPTLADPVLTALREFASQDEPALASAAGLVLVAHEHPLPQPGRLVFWRESPETAVAATAWEITAHLERRDLVKVGFSAYKPALENEDEALRDAAFCTAVVAGADWVRAYARDHAVDDPLALAWFALVAEPDDAGAFRKLVAARDLGAARFEAAASFGHPSMFEPLLAAMAADDPETAVSAGRAFTRMTGIDVETGERVAFDDGADDFDAEFAEEGFLPDPQRAKAHLDRHRKDLLAGLRWAAGKDLGVATAVLSDEHDLRTRYEEQLRRLGRGERGRRFAPLGRYPIPR